ncbi:hypothetical protein SAMN04488238_1462 [Roseicitreum antarcticum]|uniref:Uncharacterized protein n=1 Tax=Roseicitreum antarcticum TaxID=564137 RepID=A0A1H3FQR9_9RHOB|nr:hypothetical protein SAMN04488238_1462 [Roseicitreum antarcticum]
MKSTARCSRQPPAAPLIAMLWLSACATGGSDTIAPCPPIVEYSSVDMKRAADEVGALPESAIIIQMLADYAVLYNQMRACR